MRVNIYAEEMTDRVEIIRKEIDGHSYAAVRFYLELPATVDGVQHKGPFMHRPGDDDSSAVTFWGKKDLRPLLMKALDLLDNFYADRPLIRLTPIQAKVYEESKRFKEALPSLLKTLEGKWVVFRNGEVVCVQDDEEAAYIAGIELFGVYGCHVVAQVKAQDF